jgi:hypothetical protein
MGPWGWNESVRSGLQQEWHSVFFVSMENKGLTSGQIRKYGF